MTAQTPTPVISSEARNLSALPRISLVTPVFNSAKYIEQTFQSVFAQNYPNLEYFVVDGGSTDGTLDIIRKYESQLSGWISEPDNGMYDALNKGFARTTGEIMGWISATDLLQTGGLAVVGSVFRDMPPEVEWITGRPTIYNEEGATVHIDVVPRWSRISFLAHARPSIQQESTFWRRSLWEKAGARTDSSHRNGADFELWVRFFRHAQLYSVDALVGGFRVHADSLGLQDLGACYALHDEIIEKELARNLSGKLLKAFREWNPRVKKIPVVRFGWWRLIEKPVLYEKWGAPPIIECRNGRWKFRK